MKLYNRLLTGRNHLNSENFKLMFDDLVDKLSGDTSDDNVKIIAKKILADKIDLINKYKRKKKVEQYENELYVANSIIQCIFAFEYKLDVVDNKIALEKYS